MSHDVSTMPEHFARFIQTRSSPGLILISQELSYHQYETCVLSQMERVVTKNSIRAVECESQLRTTLFLTSQKVYDLASSAILRQQQR